MNRESCPISRRSADIPPFLVMEVLERAQALESEGREIIHLEVGEPDFETPACIREAGIRAIRDGKTRYTHSLGLLELREAGPDVARMVGVYDEWRRFLVRRLRELGLGITVESTGAFYVLANARHVDGDSHRLAFDILERAGVAVTPGVDFGGNAEGYLRFSYANSLEKITAALERLGAYLQAR